MQQTIQQLGELLLGSIPTMVYLLLLYGLYNVLVHKPLGRVLAERRAKTEGAIEQARADMASAESRTAEYERKLREARLASFKVQEARRQSALQSRAVAVAAAREKAREQVEAARQSITNDAQSARAGLEAEAGRLATAIVQTVLRPAVAAGER
jgi:F-type H+-transporting ATPase subunit b